MSTLSMGLALCPVETSESSEVGTSGSPQWGMGAPSVETSGSPVVGTSRSPKVGTSGSPSVELVLCLVGTSGSSEVGTSRSLSMLMMLCPCWSVLAQASWVEAMGSMQWVSKGVSAAMQSLARSAAVSKTAQKVGGEFVHPMVRDKGIARSGGSLSYEGIMMANRRASLALRNMRQKPSVMLYLDR